MEEHFRFNCGMADPRFAIPGTQQQFTEDRNFDPRHVRIELGIDIGNKTVTGTCHTTLVALRETNSIEFNAVDMKIKSVKMGKKNVKHYYDGEKLSLQLSRTVKMNEEVTIAISYRIVKPSLGIYFTGPDRIYPKKPVEVWSHSEPEHARYWYPCHDTPDVKATTEMILTVPKDFTAVSNGVLHAVFSSKNTRTFHWKMNHVHSPYLVMFAVAKFAEVKDTWRGIPVVYYCEKGKEGDIKRAFGKTPKMIEFFSTKIGVPYPYERYAQVAVEDFIFGGMEHTTSTTQSNIFLQDKIANSELPDRPDLLAAHELAHQWFGDYLTCKDWSHAWLNESFATYFETLFVENQRGRDFFLFELYQNAKAYMDEDTNRYRRPIVTNIYAEPQDMFDRHLYEKGSVVLHMIRYILGDDLWWKAINRYVAENANRPVETADLMAAIRDATGVNMKKFFDQWVFKAGHPEYKVLYHWSKNKKEAHIRVVQMQRTDEDTPLFTMPIEFEFKTGKKTVRFKETIENKEHQLIYKLPSEPVMFLFDPDNCILKKADVVKPKEMHYYEIKNNPNVIGRIKAAQEIARMGSDGDVKILENALLTEKFWPVQAEIAFAIASIKTEASLNALKNGLRKIKQPRVKRAIIECIGEYRTASAINTLKSLARVRNSYIIPAEAIHSLGKTRDVKNMNIFTAALSRESWADLVRISAINAIMHLRTDKAVDIMKEQSEVAGTNMARVAATRNMGVIGKGRKDVLDTLMELTYDHFSHVQIAAVSALGEMQDERAVPRLKELAEGHYDGRVKRAGYEALKKIYSWLDTDLTVSELRKQMDDMKKENKELRKKLSLKEIRK